MATTYQPAFINIDYFTEFISIKLNIALSVSDTNTSNWEDSFQISSFNNFLSLSDSNDSNWSDVVTINNHIVRIVSDSLNSWADASARFKVYFLSVSDTNYDSFLDEFLIKEFQRFSEDLNNWNYFVVVNKVLLKSFSDSFTITDSGTVAGLHILTPKSFAFSDDLNNLSDFIALRIEQQLNIQENNSTNWNNLLVYLKS